jgi:acyl-CoA thioesterase
LNRDGRLGSELQRIIAFDRTLREPALFERKAFRVTGFRFRSRELAEADRTTDNTGIAQAEGRGSPMASSNEAERKHPFGSSPFLEMLGTELVEKGDGRATLALNLSEMHLRTRGIAHGGVIATLLDTAMGVAVSTQTPDGSFAVTCQLNVNFVRPGWNGERLLINAEVSHTGATTAVARADMTTEDGASVAISSGTFSFVRIPNPGSELLERKLD